MSSTDAIQTTLEALTVDHLKVLVRDLGVANPSTLKTKDQLIGALLACDLRTVRKHLRKTWIDGHRTGIVVGLAGLFLTVVFGVLALPHWTGGTDMSNVPQFDSNGSLKLNLERRNATQCAKMEEWLGKTLEFKGRYFTKSPPDDAEYMQFIFEFIDYTENNFTPSQIETFNQGFGSGAGGDMFRGIDEIKLEYQEKASQLALIEFWLMDFIKLNRNNQEPEPLKNI